MSIGYQLLVIGTKEASLRKYLKATEKGYRRLINKRNEEVRNFVSNDVYEKVKEYM